MPWRPERVREQGGGEEVLTALGDTQRQDNITTLWTLEGSGRMQRFFQSGFCGGVPSLPFPRCVGVVLQLAMTSA